MCRRSSCDPHGASPGPVACEPPAYPLCPSHPRSPQLYERAVEADTTATALATYAHFLFRNPCQDASEREEEMWDLSSVESFLAANATAGSPQ